MAVMQTVASGTTGQYVTITNSGSGYGSQAPTWLLQPGEQFIEMKSLMDPVIMDYVYQATTTYGRVFRYNPRDGQWALIGQHSYYNTNTMQNSIQNTPQPAAEPKKSRVLLLL